MPEVDGVVALFLLGLWIYCIFDVIATEAASARNLPKAMWLLIVLMLPDIGSIAWLLLGRPQRAGWRPGDTEVRRHVPRSRPIGPEDATDFIARLEARDRMLAAWAEEDRAKQLGSADLPESTGSLPSGSSRSESVPSAEPPPNLADSTGSAPSGSAPSGSAPVGSVPSRSLPSGSTPVGAARTEQDLERLLAWEADLARREAELRGQQDPPPDGPGEPAV